MVDNDFDYGYGRDYGMRGGRDRETGYGRRRYGMGEASDYASFGRNYGMTGQGYGWRGRSYDYGTDYGYGGAGYGGGYGYGEAGYGYPERSTYRMGDRDYEYGGQYGRGSDYGYGGRRGGYGYGRGPGPGGYGRYGRRADMEDWMMAGPYTGYGPQGYQRSNERIREEVHERLTRHGRLDARNIRVTVDNGEVTLEGTVDSRHAKRMAEDAAEGVAGVRDVHNRLRVQQREESVIRGEGQEG